MEYSPEALLTRPKKQILPFPWPQLSGKGHSYKSHYFTDITKDNNPDDDDSTMIHNKTTSSTTHPRSLRVYPASPYDISAFIQELGCIRHRIIQFNDMSTKIPVESVPPYTQEILYLINHGYLIRNNPATIPAVKIIPHKNQTVPGFSLGWLTRDFEDRRVLERYFPSLYHESSRIQNGVIGLCSIFYLPAGSLSNNNTQQHRVQNNPNSTTEDNDNPNRILSEIYQSCRDYNVRYCLITDGSSSSYKIIELFQDSYMASSPYDIILISDNEADRPIPLTLGGLLWEGLSSIYVPATGGCLEDTDSFHNLNE